MVDDKLAYGGFLTNAAVLLKRGGPVELKQIWLPAPQPSQILLKMRASGMCLSQIGQIDNPPEKLPFLLGHEGIGEVVATGSDVTHLKVGDLAAITWVPRELKKGRWHAPPCGALLNEKPLSGYVFSWSEYCLIWQGYAIKLPADCPLEFAAIVGCAINTGAGAVLNTAKMGQNHSALIIGAGGTGLAAVAMSAALGAKTVIVADVRDSALEFARQFGATHTVNVSANTLEDAVADICNGVDFAFDTVGTDKTIEQALRSTVSGGAGANNEGGTVILIGLNHNPVAMDSSLAILHKRKIVGSLGDSNPEQDFKYYLKLLREGKFPIDKLVRARYPLEQVQTACEDIRENVHLGRTILTF